MGDRQELEDRLRELHAARVRGDLVTICSTFADDAAFQISGASDGKRIDIRACGIREFKPWLAMMVKAFRLTDYTLISLVIDPPQAAAHWRALIYSKITGLTVPTELVDLIELRSGRIVRYTEFFVPR